MEKTLDNFYTSVISEKVSLVPKELNSDIDTVILNKLKGKLGDKCNKNGYVDRKSIKLIERSIGSIKSEHFNGNVIYNVKLEAKICHPKEDDIVTCKVIGKNKMGILAVKHPLTIALSKLHHEDLDKFDSINPGDVIKVSVICIKYELNDNEIDVVAKLV